MVNLPEEFEIKMKKLLGAGYEEFLASYDRPRNFGLRVNVDKVSPKEFEKIAPFHLTKIPWTENGYYYEEQDMPARHPFYYAGMYYLQEPSAMTPASRLVSKPGDRVLDLCGSGDNFFLLFCTFKWFVSIPHFCHGRILTEHSFPGTRRIYQNLVKKFREVLCQLCRYFIDHKRIAYSKHFDIL